MAKRDVAAQWLAWLTGFKPEELGIRGGMDAHRPTAESTMRLAKAAEQRREAAMAHVELGAELSEAAAADAARKGFGASALRRLARELHTVSEVWGFSLADKALSAAIAVLAEARLEVEHAGDAGAQRRPRTQATAKESSLDTKACALLDMLEDEDSPSPNSAWRATDVAALLKCSSGSLTGKQRDKKTPRCPRFWKRWKEQQSALARRGAARRPMPDRRRNGR